MPFIPPLVAAAGTALAGVGTFLASGTFLAGVAKLGLNLAASFIIGELLGPKTQAQAVRLETRYGEDLSREVILGKVGTAGHHIHRNAYGKGNRHVQDAIVLSHFKIGEITRVRYKGEWKALEADAANPAGYLDVAGSDGRVSMRPMLGAFDQAAEAEFVAQANPVDRWTADHRLAGIAYAAVLSKLNREKQPQPWEAFFEVIGPNLYDWRKDDTEGGSGDDRWSDQASWSGRFDNPVLQMYALERGIYNGTELMVGKGASPSRMPLANWTIGANICDELIDGLPRYSAAVIASAGRGVTHESNMQPLLAACAGSWVEDASGEYPIVGAVQAAVATITDDDIMVDESLRFSHKRTRTELVNTATGSYVNPETFYQSAPLAWREDAAALAADGERLAVSIPYGAVNDPVVGDRLLDIALRASRYQANGEICVRPKFIQPKPGQWIRWNSAKFGDKTFQIAQKRLGAIGTNSARNVYWTLHEVGEGIFDPTAYETLPPDAVASGTADYQTELVGFGVTPLTIATETGAKRPAFRAAWTAIEDITITHIDFEYWPVAQPDAVMTETATADQTIQRLVAGVISLTDYEGRYRFRTDPVRTMPWVAWGPVEAPDARIGAADIYDGIAGFDTLDEDVKGYFEWIGSSRDRVDELMALSTRVADQDLANFSDKQEMRRELVSGLGAERAAWSEAIFVATGPGSALSFRIEELEATINGELGLANAVDLLSAEVTEIDGLVSANADAITLLSAEVDGVAASVTIRSTAQADPGGGWASWGVEVAVGSGDDWSAPAFFLHTDGELSRAVFVADQFIITDGTDDAQPFVFTGGVATMNVANIGTVNAGVLQSLDGKFIIDLSAGSLKIYD